MTGSGPALADVPHYVQLLFEEGWRALTVSGPGDREVGQIAMVDGQRICWVEAVRCEGEA